MNQPGSGDRVRVTRPAGASTRPRHIEVVREIDAQTPLGEIYMRSLMRSQLRLAFVVLAVLILTLGALPLVFAVVPGSREAHLLGLPLPWLLLGVLVYPALLGLGWFYVRQAERNEHDFTDLVDRP
ncbi:MAG: hypothetical protein ABJA86_01265 [Nocardioidaceae bacterium]